MLFAHCCARAKSVARSGSHAPVGARSFANCAPRASKWLRMISSPMKARTPESRRRSISYWSGRPPAGVDVIITIPPYKLADDFIRHGLSLGLPFVALLRLMALEGYGRSDLMDRHLRRVWAGNERLPMMHREGWQGPRTASGGALSRGLHSSPDSEWADRAQSHQLAGERAMTAAGALNARPVVKGTLRGFFDLQLASGLILRNGALHQKRSRRWVQLPLALLRSSRRHGAMGVCVDFIDREDEIPTPANRHRSAARSLPRDCGDT